MDTLQHITKEQLPAYIRGTRRAMGLKQADFATLIGTARYNVANYETGRNMPAADVMCRIIGLAMAQAETARAA